MHRLPNRISLADQLAELNRDRDARIQHYPGMVKAGKLSADAAIARIRRLEAAIYSLTCLQHLEHAVNGQARQQWQTAVLDDHPDSRRPVPREDHWLDRHEERADG